MNDAHDFTPKHGQTFERFHENRAPRSEYFTIKDVANKTQDQIRKECDEAVHNLMRPQAPSNLKLSPLPAKPTKDEQIKALQIAVDALLTHGLRDDLVVQARHAVEISGGKT
jgi:hypothetical protein